jgi:hypothetical protein
VAIASPTKVVKTSTGQVLILNLSGHITLIHMSPIKFTSDPKYQQKVRTAVASLLGLIPATIKITQMDAHGLQLVISLEVVMSRTKCDKDFLPPSTFTAKDCAALGYTL